MNKNINQEKINAASILYDYISNKSDKKIDAGPSYGNLLNNNIIFKKAVGKGKLKEFINEFKDIFYFVHDEKVGGKGWICIKNIDSKLFYDFKQVEKEDSINLNDLITNSLLFNEMLKNISII
jgi:hypothetical protein